MHLLRARDENKDQTYFLHRLDQSQLSQACFPLGDIEKNRVRQLARDAGLDVHGKKDSTGLCFIGERPFNEFLRRYVQSEPGMMETVDGEHVGEHQGLAFYTIGQRQGLGLGGRAGSSGEPWYVASKDMNRNALIVVQGKHHRALWCPRLMADSAHWISGSAPAAPFACLARLRHRQPLQPCRITVIESSRIQVVFDAPQFAATPGQSITFYEGDECLGGAIVDEAQFDGVSAP
jgi:tRNA-specific 2-thiouridylase